MTTDQLHTELKKVSKYSVLMKLINILTFATLLGGGITWYTNRNVTQAVDNSEIRNLIKASNADISNKITTGLNGIDTKDSIRVLNLSNQVNINHITSADKMDRIDDKIQNIDLRVRHLEYEPVISKKDKNGNTTFVPYN